ncbi:MAG: NAD-dependent epimerase/dehydratase family protein [Proteobacteria bacterium]|nr:NAD-dependent epimerase/dehydratase family protein [Pseudomonadota bacterium]
MEHKWVVIGSNSFSGATFVKALLERGERVLSISRSAENAHALLPYSWLPADQQARNRFYQLDLNQHPKDILNLIGDWHADYVVNFAAQSMVAESWLHPTQWYQTNVVANVELHEGLRRFDFLRKYIHVTTPEVYGNCVGKVTETHPFDPSTPYAASRAACDLHLMTFFKQYKFPVCFTRAANVFGPGQPLYRIIPRCVYFFLRGKTLQLHGGGYSVRSFIHMSDVAEGTLRVAQHAPAGESYHFSTNRYLPIRDVVAMIASQLGVAFEDAVEIVGERPGKDAAYLLDSTKARQALGWRDRISLEEGVAETITWARRFSGELEKLPTDYIHKV